ncbi:MAG: hypothetical protein B6244_06085 [Candidatus Cloacimonetes bacterium 4572_55]|nr:MAG: hypothetical protein B6244_06085 [Candidatus Cloacimonetes bacterium 4572_55]
MRLNLSQYFNKKTNTLMGIALVIGMVLGGVLFNNNEKNLAARTHSAKSNEHQIWTCSMHPQIRQNRSGKCPLCAMDLVLVASSQSAGMDMDPNEIEMTESAIKLADIQTVTVRRGTPIKSVRMFGKVQANERNIAEITARFGGRIEKLSVNYTGQNVRKGQKLGTVYSPDLIVAQQELLEAVKYKESNPAFYQAATSKLQSWNLSESQIHEIEYSTQPKLQFDILSPISGVVAKRHIAVGDYIMEGTRLFEVIDLTSVWVMFDAYESDLPWIKINDEIVFRIQSRPGKIYTSKISYIDPFIHPTTRIAQVRVDVPNTDLDIKPEMFVNGVLESQISESSNALLIPKSSILWTGKRAIVYVKSPDRETPTFLCKEITLGPEAGDYYVVAHGLSEGEEIAKNGVFKIDASAQLAGKRSMMNPGTNIDSADRLFAEVEIEGSSDTEKTPTPQPSNETFRVSGSCGMCKERIEKAALGLSGVISAEWNVVQQMVQVSFHGDQIDIKKIHEVIASVGHDTELLSAPDDVYNNLHGCCKYPR